MLIKSIKTEDLITEVYSTRAEMGKAAAAEAAKAIREVLSEKEYANVIFAAAPSQNEMLEALLLEDLDFSRINAFHMDEYAGLGINDAQSFATYLYEHIFSRAPFASINYVPAKDEPAVACAKYTELLQNNPPDVVCMGIGENGHIAFNDPPVADFKDPYLIKKVELDEVCRMQQVHDGCFPSLDRVPQYALTLTVPALLSAKRLICTVPAATKAAAVKATLYGEFGEICPATSLRRHKGAKMFLDQDSAKEVL
jgi:glucosamine-6-phosphate deaminase